MLTKRSSSPFWWAEFTVAGVRHRFSTKRTSRAEAKAVAEIRLKELLDQAQGLAPKSTIRLSEALARNAKVSREQRDQRGLVSRTRKLMQAFGDVPLDRIDQGVIDAAIEAWQDQGNSMTTIARVLIVLKKVMRNTEKAGMRVGKWEMPRVKSVVKTRYLSLDEEQRLLRELWPLAPEKRAANPYLKTRQQQIDAYDLTLLLLDTGLRYGEATSLTWEDIDTETWSGFRVWRSKTQNASQLHMTARVRAVLQARYEEAGNTVYVFSGYSDSLSPRGHATKAICKAMDRAGINTPTKIQRWGKATVHSLRDTFASRLAERGYPIHMLKGLLGHSDIKTTMRYAHWSEAEASRKAVEVLEAY